MLLSCGLNYGMHHKFWLQGFTNLFSKTEIVYFFLAGKLDELLIYQVIYRVWLKGGPQVA